MPPMSSYTRPPENPIQSSSSQQLLGIQQTVIRRLQAFLDSNPPRLEVKPCGSTSKATRKPAFFDLHLHHQLRLKKIVMVDDLAQKLADTCDRNLTNGVRNICNAKAADALYIRKEAITEDMAVFNEETVARNYCNLAGAHCSRIASTFLFGLKDFKNSILKWNISPETPQAHAKADGFLSVVLPRQTDVETVSSSPDDMQVDPEIPLSASDQLDIELMGKYHLQHTAVSEVKSLSAGNGDVMQEIGNLGREDAFVWEVCGGPGAFEELSTREGTDKKGKDCSSPKKHMTYTKVSVTGRKTGPDVGATSEYWSSATESSLNPKMPVNLANREKACFIVQQAWAEAVMNDASFIIFHSGNLEYIGIRHRQSQTLYLSRLIDVPNAQLPAYHRIHVGLFIASYKDTLARTKVLHRWRTQSPRNEHTYPLYTQNYDSDNLPYNGIKISRKRLSDAERFTIDRAMYSELDKANSLQITIPKGFLPEQIACSFFKVDGRDTADSAAARLMKKQREGCPALHLVAPTSFPGTLRVWRFQLMKPIKNSTKVKKHSTGLIIKFAKEPHEMEELYREDEMYQKLNQSKTLEKYLPRMHGIFAFDSEMKKGVPRKVLAMVMRDAGESIQLLRNNGKHEQIESQTPTFYKTLNTIHEAGYVICDGLSAQNILIIKDTKIDPIPIRFINVRTWKQEQEIPEKATLEQHTQIKREIDRLRKADTEGLANIIG